MSHEHILDGKTYTPATDAGKHFGYTKDYMLLLIKQVTIDEILNASSSVTSLHEGDTFWSRLTQLVQGFVDGVLTLTGIKADRVDVNEELCVDGVCVTADDLRALLQSINAEAGGSGDAGTGTGVAPIEGGDTSGGTTEEPVVEGEGGGTVPPAEEPTTGETVAEVTESTPPEDTGTETLEEIVTEEPVVEEPAPEQTP